MSYGLKLKCAETEKSIEGYTDHGVMDPSSPASRIMVKLLHVTYCQTHVPCWSTLRMDVHTAASSCLHSRNRSQSG